MIPYHEMKRKRKKKKQQTIQIKQTNKGNEIVVVEGEGELDTTI